MFSHPPSQISIPAIVQYELEVGLRKAGKPQKRTNQLASLLTTVQILPFDHKAAGQAAKIRADLETKGTPIGPYDILIAGTAMANNGILVTHNLDEFQRMPNLRIEDWYTLETQ